MNSLEAIRAGIICEDTVGVLETNGWNISGIYDEPSGDFYAELEYTSSPSCEDYIATVYFADDVSFRRNFAEYARSFDVDEHVVMYVDNRGENGVPDSISVLLANAEDIRDTLIRTAVYLSLVVDVFVA